MGLRFSDLGGGGLLLDMSFTQRLYQKWVSGLVYLVDPSNTYAKTLIVLLLQFSSN